MSVIKVENLIKNYKKSTWKESEEDVKVLKGISFQAEQGEFVGIMGKSGCGKTTLLKNLGMIDKPTNGKIQFAGEDTDSLYGDKLAEIRNRKIGFVISGLLFDGQPVCGRKYYAPNDFEEKSGERDAKKSKKSGRTI